ncbi:MAG: ADOP family duplicated permease [Acidobacteriia bacterium]|nr:ADOP family duplicated permease [Terriglobia bacterium]
MPSFISQAWRSWKSGKAVALVAALALAVGIGSTTAIYTVVNAVMLKPLPYPHGERWVALYGASFSEPTLWSASNFPDLLEYQQLTHSFDVFGWLRSENYNLTSPGEPRHVIGAAVTPSLAHHIGVNPIVGQWFRDDAGAVISYTLWKRLGGDPSIIGKAIALNGRSYTVTGLMPPAFRLPLPGPGVDTLGSDVWISLDPHGAGRNPDEAYYVGYARRKPGIALSQAEADVKHAAAEIAKLNPVSHPSYTARLVDVRESVSRDIRPTLLLLFAAAGLLLLITCANVAGLLLARAVSRARETATRVALGAAPRQLALQYFMEGLFVSLAGAAAGVVVSAALVRVVVSIAVDYIPRADEIAIDWKVLLFAAGTACLASALSSLAPLWQAARTFPNEVLNEGVRASAGARSRKLSQSLVVAEIALAFTLLTVSGVLISHLRNLARIRPGFEPDHLLSFQLTVADAAGSSAEKLWPYQKRLIESLEAISGVGSAAIANQLPLNGCCLSTAIYAEGRPANPNQVQRTSFMVISPEYFRTMRIPLRSGRFLNEHDARNDALFVVINQAAAKRDWPNQEPVGAYGRLAGPNGSRFQVVGIAGDVKNNGLGSPTVPEIYFLSAVAPVNPMLFVVRSPLPAERLVPEVRRAVQRVDPLQPIHDVTAMNDIAQGSLSLERVGTFMTAFFALAALLMTTLGIYGVVSYSVRQRRVEIGTRMALGAVSRDVLFLVVGGGLRMAVYGLAFGGLAVATAAWLLARVVAVHDVGFLPFASSTAIVAVIAMGASLFPAWRASLLSPMVAMRNDPASMWQSAYQRIRQAVQGMSRAEDVSVLSDGSMLTEFVDASRRAASFAEALQSSLATLCGRVGGKSAMLLEKVSGQEYRRAAATPEQAFSDCSLPAEGFLLNRLRFYAFPLPFNGGDVDTWQRWAKEYRPQYLAEIETLKNTGARLAVSLRTKSEILGVLLLGPPEGRESYSRAETRALGDWAQQLALMMENARLTDRVVEQEKVRRDLALAVEVQRRLLPEQPPQTAVAELAAISLPARSIGGDYYDFLDAGDHRIGIALADIAGKGIAAALIMSVVQASLRILSTEENISLPQLAAKMNRFLHGSTKSNSYATFFYAQIDDRNRQLRYVNAGHNPPYLLRSIENSEIEELSTGGTVLGLFPQVSYQEATVDLQPGDVLVAFTDGVTEALNPHEEEFGEERLKNLLRQVVHLPAHEMSVRISHELRNWIKDAAQYDDLTFVVMKVN